jgi:hypothetical protein
LANLKTESRMMMPNMLSMIIPTGAYVQVMRLNKKFRRNPIIARDKKAQNPYVATDQSGGQYSPVILSCNLS